MFDELEVSTRTSGIGGFLPAVKQIGNVAALPAIVNNSIGLPDIHSGYGFAIGNIAALVYHYIYLTTLLELNANHVVK